MRADFLSKVRANISAAAARSGRKPGDIRLICVTKEAGVNDISALISLGETDIGENRVQDALLKYKTVGNAAKWHLIGHLQTNKARDAVNMFSLIHSVDSERLAQAIDKYAKIEGKVQEVLLQVNVSGEDTKFGVAPEELERLMNAAGRLKNIKVNGLMTITPLSADPERSRPYFKRLKDLASGMGLKQLSMGMSQDYMTAVEEGSTMVRVGRAIFRG